MQAVIVAPVLYFVLPDQIQGTYQLHALEICAVELRHHGLYLSAVEHTHEYGLDNVVKMMSQCYLVAAQSLCVAVQVSPSHACAYVAGILLDIVHGIKYVRLEDMHGNGH